MKTKAERISDLINYCGNASKFAKRIGVAPGAMSNYINRGTYDYDKILAAFPELSSEWILRGTGPMFEADLERDEQQALDTLGITREQLDCMRACANEEGTHAYTHVDPTHPTVNEPTATSSASSLDMITIPRAVLNALTQQLDVKDAQIEALIQQLSKLK